MSRFKTIVGLAVTESPVYQYVRNRLRHPGLAVAPRVGMSVAGRFSYGDAVSIGTGSSVVVPPGGQLRLGSRCYLGRHVEVGATGSIAVGEAASIQDRCIVLGDVSIGRYCVFAPNIYLSSGQHHFERHPTWYIQDQDAEVLASEGRPASRPIRVDDDCWLGINVVVMPGVRIGRGCVVGANSVVTKSLPPYSVAAGSPARVIRRRLDFLPPRAIDAAREDDHPYFYAGFEQARRELASNQHLGGLVARGDFSLWLAVTEQAELFIRARALAPTGAAVRLGETAVALPAEMATLSLGRVGPQDPDSPLDFRLEGPAGSGIVVERAWLQ